MQVFFYLHTVLLSGCAGSSKNIFRGSISSNNSDGTNNFYYEAELHKGILTGNITTSSSANYELYIDAKTDIETDLDYSLVRYQGNLIISYIASDGTETIIADTSKLDSRTNDN